MDVGGFNDAIAPLKLDPVCPGCGDMRQLEQLNSRVWRCDTRSKRFEVPQGAGSTSGSVLPAGRL